MAISGVLASYIWHVFECMQNPPIIKRCSLLTFCFYHHLVSPSLCSLSFCSVCFSVGSVCQGETTEQCRVHLVLFFEECLPGVPGVTDNCEFIFWEWHLWKHFLLWLLLVWTCHKGAESICDDELLVLTAEVVVERQENQATSGL